MAKGLVNISSTTGRIPSGGTVGQVLKKNSNLDRDVVWGDGSQAINGIPLGGNTGQILSKIDGVDYNVQWTDFQEGSVSGTGNINNCNVTIPITGWVANSGDYLYKVDIPVASVVATDILIMTIDKDSLDVASASHLCSSVDSYDGGVTVYSKSIPTEELSANCTIISLATLQNLLPSGGTTGQILSKVDGTDYNVQWSDYPKYYANPIDTPPLIASTWDDEFDGNTLNNKWSWINQETASTSLLNSKLGMIIPSCTLPKAIIQPAPSGAFTMIAKINLNSNEVNFLQFGIAVYNSANTRMLVFGKGARSGVRSIHITRLSISAWNTDLFLEHGIGGSTIYCKMVYDGTNLICSYSLDGDFYVRVCTEPLSSYVLGITHLAICSYRNNTTSTEDVIGVCDWFRVTTP